MSEKSGTLFVQDLARKIN